MLDIDLVEARVGERQVQGIPRREWQRRSTVVTDEEHARREVARHDVSAAFGHGLAGGAGAGCEVEDDLPRLGRDGIDQRTSPDASLTQGEHLVGDVVALGDAVEHGRDITWLLVQVRTHPRLVELGRQGHGHDPAEPVR